MSLKCALTEATPFGLDEAVEDRLMGLQSVQLDSHVSTSLAARRVPTARRIVYLMLYPSCIAWPPFGSWREMH